MAYYRSIMEDNFGEVSLQHYKAKEFKSILSKDDIALDVRPELSTVALNNEVIYRIGAPSENHFIDDVFLVNTFGPISGSDATRKFVRPVGLRSIERIQVYSAGKMIWECLDILAPYQKILFSAESTGLLPHIRDLIGDEGSFQTVSDADRRTSGLKTYLKLDHICPIFAYPLFIAKQSVIELRIKYRSGTDITTGTGANTSLVESLLKVNYAIAPDRLTDYVRTVISQNAFEFPSLRYFHQEFTIPSGSTSFSVNIPSYLQKTAVLLTFNMRAQSDLTAKNFYNYKRINNYNLKVGGTQIDGANQNLTHEDFNTWMLLTNRVNNPLSIKNTNVYMIDWSDSLQDQFREDAETYEFSGGKYISGTDLTLYIDFPSISEQHVLSLDLVIPQQVVIRPGGVIDTVE